MANLIRDTDDFMSIKCILLATKGDDEFSPDILLQCGPLIQRYNEAWPGHPDILAVMNEDADEWLHKRMFEGSVPIHIEGVNQKEPWCK